MATSNRTFKFYGQGYGDTNVSIVAKINNSVVFSGEIPTIPLTGNIQPTPLPSEQVVLFSIDNSSALNTDFAGSLPMTIDITGGDSALFGNVMSNFYETPNSKNIIGDTAVYTEQEYNTIINPNSTSAEVNAIIVPKANPPFSDADMAFLNQTTPYTQEQIDEFYILLAAHNIPINVSSGPDLYQWCYTGVPVNSEQTVDTRSSVTINGQTQVPPIPKSVGTWNWYVPTSSTLGYNWNISVGFANTASLPGNVSVYSGDYQSFARAE